MGLYDCTIILSQSYISMLRSVFYVGLTSLSPFPVKVMTSPLTRQVSDPARKSPDENNQLQGADKMFKFSTQNMLKNGKR